LVATLLVLAFLQQARPPELTVALDRDEVAVGEEVLLTVRTRSASAMPIEVRLGSTDGFVIVSRSEATTVNPDAAVPRSKTIELRLRAIRAGRWTLGPFQARQGDTIAEVGAITVHVTDSGSAAVAAQINPRIRRLLEQARPPTAPGKVGLSLLVSATEVTVGEQVDIVTAAWFPRDLRLQLRRAPTLVPPSVEGMWSYPQPAPVGIAATRLVGGTFYDLFVAHQIAFPVRSGKLAIAPAQMQYSVPLALQFFSQEERFSVTSDSAVITVDPIPETGRPADFAGAVGTDLSIERVVTPATARAREPVHVAFVVRGRGNVTLWPPPDITWPAGSRAYPDLVEERPETRDGFVTGSKRFGFMLVADSVGTLVLPQVSYSYWDLGTRSFRVARVPAANLPVASAAAMAEGALPPALLRAGPSLVPASFIDGPRPLGWLALALGPVLVWGIVSLVRRRSGRRAPPPPPRAANARTVEIEMDRLVTGLAPAALLAGDGQLAAALRAAGLEPEFVERLLELRAELRQQRYAPEQAEQTADIVSRWEALRAQLAGGGRRRRVSHGLLGLLLVAVLARPANAQGTSAESLYEAGDLGSARAAFAARAEAQPDIAAHWYNLGATDYRLGSATAANAEWLHALRLDPRSGTIRQALQLTPAPDPVSAARLWTAPFTPSEMALLALLLWLLAWTGLIARPIHAIRWGWIGGVALVLGGTALWLQHRYSEPVAVVRQTVPLRVSPHGRGSAVATLNAGQAVMTLREQRGWKLVRDPADRLGWVPDSAVVPVGPE
jgi:tetratricopeptide (TPR) repeat protein